MYEWRVTVNCPVRSLEATEEFERRGRFHRTSALPTRTPRLAA
jgi:hypothetical protein